MKNSTINEFWKTTENAAYKIENVYYTNIDIFEHAIENGKLPIFSNNNSKLGKDCFEFNGLPFVGCNHVLCDGCYSIQNTTRYGYNIDNNNLLKSRCINQLYIDKHLDELKRFLEIELAKLAALNKYCGCNYRVRIHSHGDFTTFEYALMWYDLIKEFPELPFYGYSKQYEILRILDFDKQPNCKMFASQGLHHGRIFLPPPDIRDRYCIACIDYNYSDKKCFTCPGNCTECKDENGLPFCADTKLDMNVLFIAHGNAAKQIHKITENYINSKLNRQ